jgi:hypothetical protein
MSHSSFPESTSELLALIDQEWNALMQVVDRLTPRQMTAPDSGGWSPKDNLAHLAAWMHVMKDSYLHKMPEYQAMGIDAERFKQLDTNGINAVLFERNRKRSAAEVLSGLKSTYAEAVQALQGVPYADLMKPMRESGPERLIDEVLWNTADHFREHRLTIEKILGNNESEAA